MLDKNPLFNVSTIHLLLLKQKYEISPLRFTSVEMTYKEKASFSSQTLKVNNFQILFKHAIENKIFHVIVLCTENPPTRHLERSLEISHNYLGTNNCKSCKGLL